MLDIPPSGARAGRRRFWITVFVFALLNAATWVGYHQWSQSRLHLLRVEKFEPGSGAFVAARPTFSWEFNLDVAHGDLHAPPPGSISPAISGQWLWHNARTLTFTPDADLPKATRFTVSLAADRVRTSEGIRLASNYAQTVQTSPLEVRNVRQAACDERDQLVVELEFSDRVLPADVVSHLRIKDPDGQLIPFKLHGEAAGPIIRVQTNPIPALNRDLENAWVMVDVSPGLAGTSGPLEMVKPLSQRLAVSSSLQATNLSAYVPSEGDAELNLSLNNRGDLETIRPVISVDPAIAFKINGRGQSNMLTLRGAFECGKRYAVKIAAPPAGTDPKKFPRPGTLSVLVPDRSPSFWFPHREGYLGAAGNRTLLAKAVNSYELKVVISRVYDDNLVAWRTNMGRSGNAGAIAYGHPIASRRIELPKEKNKVQELRLSLDELLPADAPRDGVYRVSLLDDSGRHISYSRSASHDAAVDEADTDEQEDRYSSADCLITLSDIGLSARQSADEVMVWAVSLSTGKPLPGVRIRAFSSKNQAMGETQTDGDGLARIKGIHPPAGEQLAVILAEVPQASHIADTTDASPAAAQTSPPRGLTWLDLRSSETNTAGFETAGRPYLRKGFEAFLYTDRGVYRPGEKVYLRAIVRGADQATPPSFPVRWQLRRPDLRNWKAETVKLDADGAALLEVNLPTDVPTGQWSADLAIPGENGKPERSFGSIAFQVEEFLPNRMKIALTVADASGDTHHADRVSLVNGPLTVHTQADYLFGRPVTELPATLAARAEPIPFHSDKWDSWTFGDAANVTTTLGGQKPTGGRVELANATLDAKGHATWKLDAAAILPRPGAHPESPARRPARHADPSVEAQTAGHTDAPATQPTYTGPWRLTFATSVCEAGGRAVNASRTVDVDVAPYYIAVHPTSASATPNSPYAFELALVANDGSVVQQAGEVELLLYREIWNTTLVQDGGRYHYNSTQRLEPVGTNRSIAVDRGRAVGEITAPVAGSYIASVRDPRTGGFTTFRFIAAQDAWEDNVSREDPEKLEVLLLPESPTFAALFQRSWDLLTTRSAGLLWHHGLSPLAETAKKDLKFHSGERAQVIVRSPFPGQLLLTVETDHVLSTRLIEMTQSHVTVPIEITADCRPNAYVTATVIRRIDPNAKWQTHRAYGVAPVLLDNTDRKLTVQIVTPTEVRPSRSLGIDLRITDSTGKPAANAAVTVAAVDEGILQLTNFQTPNPFPFFSARRALGVRWSDLYSSLIPEVALPERNSAIGGDGDPSEGASHQTAVSAKRVRPVSLVSGVLHTDADGITHADFPVPEFSGQLRVMAVTYGGRSTGSGEGRVFVRSPLMVQSSWPRFAAPGDKFSVPLVIFNNTAQNGTAEVSLELLSEEGASNPLQFAGVNNGRLTLAPIDVKAGGQVIVSVEVSARQAIGVGRVILIAKMNGESYQESLELPVRPASPFVTVGGYVAAKAGVPTTLPAAIEMMEGTGALHVQVAPWPTLELPRGLEYLEQYPYGCAEQTISASFPLIALGDLGKQLAPGVFEETRVKEKLQFGIMRLIGMQTADGGIAMWPGDRNAWPWAGVYAAHFVVEAQAAGHKIPDDFRDHLFTYVRALLNKSDDGGDVLEQQAYACYVLALAGRPERTVMSRLTEIVNHPPPSASDHPEVTSQTRFHLAAAWLVAGRRDLAMGLIPQTLPQPRTTRQLTGNVGSPVRERAIIVSALLAIDPDHPALPALIQQLADAGAHHGWSSTQDTAFAILAIGKYLRQAKAAEPFDSAELRRGDSILAHAADGATMVWDSKSPGGAPIELHVTGPAAAKAHVSWLQTGIPLKAPADSDSGMKVRRRYLNAKGEPLKQNTVHSGDLVQIELTVEALTPLDNLVIDDLLPAGLEIENPRLQTTAEVPDSANSPTHAPVVFAEGRVDFRDDRLILCGHLSGAGSGKYTYLARAVSPGTFVIPPVRGECMYDISINSISGGDQMLTVLSAGKAAVAASDARSAGQAAAR